MRLFKVDCPQDRTAGEIFAAHCASYVFNLPRDIGARHVSLGDSAGQPIGLYSPAQLTALGGALHVTGARFMCDLADLVERICAAGDRCVYYDACHSVYDLTLERYIK